MGEKVGFTNRAFEKLCSPENTILIVFQQNTAVAVKKLYVENRKFMKTTGLFLNMAKRCFLVCFLGVLMFLWFVFVCLVKLQEC